MEFFDALVRFEVDLWNRLDRELAAADAVRLGQLDALRVLDRRDGAARVAEISGDLSITVGAASKLVDRLERGGLAERRPSPDDRRSSFVALTPAGRAALDHATSVARRALAELLAAPGVDVPAVTADLQRMHEHLRSSAAVRA